MLVKFIVSLIIIFQLFIFPSLVLAQTEEKTGALESSGSAGITVDSYSLFWPLSAGKTMGDSLYSLKLLRERIGGLFKFGDSRKSEYNVTLSEKRLLEAEKLFIQKKDYKNGIITLEEAKNKRHIALDYIKSAEKNNNQPDRAKGTFVNSLNNQGKLLRYLESIVPDDQKKLFSQSLEDIDSLLSEIK